MRILKLTLAYDGTSYSGWQTQPGRATLQQTFERALSRVVGEEIRVIASGRTDAGVHALGQVVSFRCHSNLPPQVLQKALNSELPFDIAVLEAAEAPEGFHAIASARRKRYRYVLCDGPIRDVFARNYAWHCYAPLNAEAMHRAGQPLVGTHDFASFQTAGSPRESSVRTVLELSVARGQGGRDDRIAFEIEADGFLYNMVRAIVGTLVEVGQGRRGEAWPAEVLGACDRQAAGRTAPPQGLFLVRVDY
jgi:tRNA pseudouridine38-40 synthase